MLVALAAQRERLSNLRLAWRTHLVMALALAPLTALLFGEVPWWAPIANLLTVPWSTVFVVPLVLPGMLTRRWGRIVNVASTAGLKGYAYVSAYVAAKHGLVGLTLSLIHI